MLACLLAAAAAAAKRKKRERRKKHPHFLFPGLSLTLVPSTRTPLPLYGLGFRIAMTLAAACVTWFLSRPHRPTSVGSGTTAFKDGGSV